MLTGRISKLQQRLAFRSAQSSAPSSAETRQSASSILGRLRGRISANVSSLVADKVAEQDLNTTPGHVETDALLSSLVHSVPKHTSQEIDIEPLPPSGRRWYHWKGGFEDDEQSQCTLRPLYHYNEGTYKDDTVRKAVAAYSQGSVVGLALCGTYDLGPSSLPHLQLKDGSFQDRRRKNPHLEVVTNNPEVLLSSSVRSAISELDMYCRDPANTSEGLQKMVDSVIKDLNSTGSSIVTRLHESGTIQSLRTNLIVHEMSDLSPGTIATLSGQNIIAVAQTDDDEPTRSFFVHLLSQTPKIDPRAPSAINYIASLPPTDFDEAFGASWTKSVTVGDAPFSFVRVPMADVTKLADDPDELHEMCEVPLSLYKPS